MARHFFSQTLESKFELFRLRSKASGLEHTCAKFKASRRCLIQALSRLPSHIARSTFVTTAPHSTPAELVQLLSWKEVEATDDMYTELAASRGAQGKAPVCIPIARRDPSLRAKRKAWPQAPGQDRSDMRSEANSNIVYIYVTPGHSFVVSSPAQVLNLRPTIITDGSGK